MRKQIQPVIFYNFNQETVKVVTEQQLTQLESLAHNNNEIYLVFDSYLEAVEQLSHTYSSNDDPEGLHKVLSQLCAEFTKFQNRG